MDKQKIDAMTKGGKILSEVLSQLIDMVREGITPLELDMLAEKLIRERGGEPGFKKVPGYKHTLCVSVNDVVVHGIPTNEPLKAGDIVGIDCGVFYKGFHTDMAQSVKVKSQKSKIKSFEEKNIEKFLRVGYESMWAGIRQAKAGNKVGHISSAMQKVNEEGGYSVVRNLVGHGVGRELHESPEIPGYLKGSIEKTPILKDGMTIAVEAIYNQGRPEVAYGKGDGWTITTVDGTMSGMFERTILINGPEPIILTPDIPLS